MSHLLCYTIRVMKMKNEQPTYTLWNGNNIVASYSHTREGMDAAMVRAHELTVGGYGKLSLYSSRDDLVWTSTNEEPSEPEENLGGWPGDGSGMDDLADFNAMEGYDY